MASSGRDILFYVNTATLITGAPDNDNPVWTIACGQRNATLNLNMDDIETTNKCSGDWKEFIHSYKEWDQEIEAILEKNDGAFQSLLSAFFNDYFIKVQLVLNAPAPQDTFEGLAIITGLPIETPHDDVSTVSFTVKGTGAITQSIVPVV